MMRTVDRIIGISDIHGQNAKLLKLLDKTAYEPAVDLLVLGGDLIDRGEENLATFATCVALRKKGAILLKGNHEQFLQQSLQEMISGDTWRTHPSEGLRNWIQHNGGGSMYHEIKELSQSKLLEIFKIVQGLPFYFTIGKFIFTHAGANTLKAIEQNSENETVWMDKSFPFYPAYQDKVLIFGHVPTWKLHSYQQENKKEDTKIWYDRVNKDKIGIDCGSIFGGRLAAIELPRYKEFYV